MFPKGQNFKSSNRIGMAMGEIAKLTGLSLREVQQICQST